MSDDELDPLAKRLLDMVEKTSKDHADSTRSLINRFFALLAVLLVVNGALSGANLAMNAFGISITGEAPERADRVNIAAADDVPMPEPVLYIVNENDTGGMKNYADEPIELYEDPPE